MPVLPASALLPPPAYDSFLSATSSREAASSQNPSMYPSPASPQVPAPSFAHGPVPVALSGPPQFSAVPEQRPTSGLSLRHGPLATSTPTPGTPEAPPLPAYGAQYNVAQGATSCYVPPGPYTTPTYYPQTAPNNSQRHTRRRIIIVAVIVFSFCLILPLVVFLLVYFLVIVPSMNSVDSALKNADSYS
ncbi:hypothetical protein AAVH_33431 [Aphelenchoides avenae]|nr:hypothetical protein AAVH_33431 [Aphelenchus avenae]